MTTLPDALPSRVLAVDPGPGFDVTVGLWGGLGSGAVGAFLTTLIVGAILIAVAPEYTQNRMGTVVGEPLGSFLSGLVALLALVVVVVILTITVIGIVVAVPLLILAVVAWGVGATIGYLTIADRLIGHADGWQKPLLAAAVMNGGLALTGIGGLVSFGVGAAGFGAVLRSYLG